MDPKESIKKTENVTNGADEAAQIDPSILADMNVDGVEIIPNGQSPSEDSDQAAPTENQTSGSETE